MTYLYLVAAMLVATLGLALLLDDGAAFAQCEAAYSTAICHNMLRQ